MFVGRVRQGCVSLDMIRETGARMVCVFGSGMREAFGGGLRKRFFVLEVRGDNGVCCQRM